MVFFFFFFSRSLSLCPNYLVLDLVDKVCQTQYCLGDICRFDNQNCYEGCAEFSDFESSNSSCLEASRELELTCGIDGVDCDGTFSCVFCPEDGSAVLFPSPFSLPFLP